MVEKKFTISLSARRNHNENITFVIDDSIVSEKQLCHVSEHAMYDRRISMGVKELIIEWEDFQSEVAGVISCEDCLKYVFHKRSEDSHLIRFVKPRGRKISFIQIPKEEFNFIELYSFGGKFQNNIDDISTSVRYEQNLRKTPRSKKVHIQHSFNLNEDLELEIKPLFGEQVLPIKNAYITVEMSVEYSRSDVP